VHVCQEIFCDQETFEQEIFFFQASVLLVIFVYGQGIYFLFLVVVTLFFLWCSSQVIF
jgi:hypothetical protein